MDRGAWRAAIHGGAKSQTTEATQHAHSASTFDIGSKAQSKSWWCQDQNAHVGLSSYQYNCIL